MSDNKLVTVIMPVYNVEQYLDKAVQSAVDQTYRNLEIILVDDGSADRSGEMCDIWQKKDSRIRVIHKKNGGLSDARNAALDVCKGEYILFLDSDDYISADYVELMLRDAVRFDADIVEATLYHVYNGSESCFRFYNEPTVLDTARTIEYELGGAGGGGSISSCTKLFKREIFSSYRYQVGKLYEDLYAIVDLLIMAKVFVVEPDARYYYVHRSDSITTNHFTERSLQYIDAAEYNHRVVSEKYPEAAGATVFRIDYCTLKIIDLILLDDGWKENRYLPDLVKRVRANKNRIINSKYMAKTRKAAFLVLLFSVSAYRQIVLSQARKRNLT